MQKYFQTTTQRCLEIWKDFHQRMKRVKRAILQFQQSLLARLCRAPHTPFPFCHQSRRCHHTDDLDVSREAFSAWRSAVPELQSL